MVSRRVRSRQSPLRWPCPQSLEARAVQRVGLSGLSRLIGAVPATWSNAAAHAQRCIATEPAGLVWTRLHGLLELLVISGVRLDELAQARWVSLSLVTPPELPPTWILSVTGKRNKTRDVPLADEVVALLRHHDFAESEADHDESDRPLIFALRGSVPQWGLVAGAVRHVAVAEESEGAASASGIYAVLKRFFGRAAASAGEAGLDASRLEAASTHWMRHKFA